MYHRFHSPSVSPMVFQNAGSLHDAHGNGVPACCVSDTEQIEIVRGTFRAGIGSGLQGSILTPKALTPKPPAEPSPSSCHHSHPACFKPSGHRSITWLGFHLRSYLKLETMFLCWLFLPGFEEVGGFGQPHPKNACRGTIAVCGEATLSRALCILTILLTLPIAPREPPSKTKTSTARPAAAESDLPGGPWLPFSTWRMLVPQTFL